MQVITNGNAIINSFVNLYSFGYGICNYSNIFSPKLKINNKTYKHVKEL